MTWQQSQCSQCGDINNSSGGSHWLQDRGNKDHRGELNNLRAGGETVWEDKVSRRSLSRPTFHLNVNVGRHAKGKKRKQGCLFLDFHLIWHNRVVTYYGLSKTCSFTWWAFFFFLAARSHVHTCAFEAQACKSVSKKTKNRLFNELNSDFIFLTSNVNIYVNQREPSCAEPSGWLAVLRKLHIPTLFFR